MNELSDESGHVKSSSEVLYLLGNINAKVDGVANEQTNQRNEVQAIRQTLDKELSNVKSEIGSLKEDVSVLKSQQKPFTPWWSVAGGFAGIAAIIVFVVDFFGRQAL